MALPLVVVAIIIGRATARPLATVLLLTIRLRRDLLDVHADNTPPRLAGLDSHLNDRDLVEFVCVPRERVRREVVDGELAVDRSTHGASDIPAATPDDEPVPQIRRAVGAIAELPRGRKRREVATPH